jgi:tripartite-type tricarboxylate transporter receptor subunit TctC
MDIGNYDTAHKGWRRRRLLAALGAAAVMGPGRARPAVPPRALRIVCASPPGGAPDVIARHYAAQWPGATVVVENRPGAAGFIAVGALMQAAPDGATMLLGHGGLLTLSPFLHARLPYTPADLVPVSTAAETAFGLVLGTSVPDSVRSLAAFVEWARASPARAQFGTPLVGTMTHVLGLMLARDAGFALTHVPYPGGPQVIGDLLGGRLAAAILPVGLLRPAARARHVGRRTRPAAFGADAA